MILRDMSEVLGLTGDMVATINDTARVRTAQHPAEVYTAFAYMLVDFLGTLQPQTTFGTAHIDHAGIHAQTVQLFVRRKAALIAADHVALRAAEVLGGFRHITTALKVMRHAHLIVEVRGAEGARNPEHLLVSRRLGCTRCQFAFQYLVDRNDRTVTSGRHPACWGRRS